MRQQVTWRYHGCASCSPIVAGAVLIGVGIGFQTGWAADIASFLIKAVGVVLVGLGAITVLLSVVAWFTGRRRLDGPP